MKSIVAVVVVGAMALTVSGPSAAQAPPVQAFPAPGAKAAQRGTEISLRGIAPDAIGTVVVAGSRSGEHAGALSPHSDGNGASFVPETAFRPGERVTVRTDLNVRGGEDGDYRFTILRGEFETGTTGSETRVPPARRGTYHAYRSDPGLRTPRLVVDRRRAGRAPGYLVMNTGWDEDRPRPEGVLIATDDGEPVFFRRRTAQRKLFDVAVQDYRGQQVLTYWEGRFAAGWGYGEYVMLDSAYREIARIGALGGYRADIHDMQITPEGTALVLVYNRIEHDLRPWGGRRGGEILDNVIQEIDLQTGRLLFEWHSVDHIKLGESRDRPEGPDAWDYFHLNAVDVAPDGDLLISARNTCAVYELDRRTGRVHWTMGGRRSDFRLDRSTRFCRQHDARWNSRNELSIFDNHIDSPQAPGESRAIKLRVNETARRVKLLRGYKHPAEPAAPNKGGARLQPNGNMLVAWGAIPMITEFTRKGRIVLNARFAGATDGSYRAQRASWVGRPATDPNVAAEAGDDGVRAWASWNGATEVARWQLLGGATPDTLAPIGSAPRDGFETTLTAAGAYGYVAVQALDASGAVLGTSAAVQPQ
jgi:Arylsulfotransferase (ASST)